MASRGFEPHWANYGFCTLKTPPYRTRAGYGLALDWPAVRSETYK